MQEPGFCEAITQSHKADRAGRGNAGGKPPAHKRVPAKDITTIKNTNALQAPHPSPAAPPSPRGRQDRPRGAHDASSVAAKAAPPSPRGRQSRPRGARRNVEDDVPYGMKFYNKQDNLHCVKIVVPCRGQAPGPQVGADEGYYINKNPNRGEAAPQFFIFKFSVFIAPQAQKMPRPEDAALGVNAIEMR